MRRQTADSQAAEEVQKRRQSADTHAAEELQNRRHTRYTSFLSLHLLLHRLSTCPSPPALYLTLSAPSLRECEGVLGRAGRMMHGNAPRGVPAPPVSRPHAGDKRLRLYTSS